MRTIVIRLHRIVFLGLLLALGAALSIGSAKAAQDQKKPSTPQTQPTRRTPKQSTTKVALSAEEVKEARSLLDALGYWVAPVAPEVADAAKPDDSLRHALIAFQKIEGRPRSGNLTQEELNALRQAQPPTARETGYPHIEVDLERQVLFVVECGDKELRILPISSGSGEFFTEGGVTRQAITPTGRFKIQRKIEGWRKSPLGLLYYPNYFYDGVAIHGNPSVPVKPASHGCVRIPMFASEELSELVTIGLDVIVYDSLMP